MRALSEFSEAFAQIPPYKQKELVRLVVQRVELTPDSMNMALYGRVAPLGPVCEGGAVSRTGISVCLRGCASIRTGGDGRNDSLWFRVVYITKSSRLGYVGYQGKCEVLE